MARRYWAQAVLVTYETFHLATGQDVKLPTPDRGDGMHWSRWATGTGMRDFWHWTSRLDF